MEPLPQGGRRDAPRSEPKRQTREGADEVPPALGAGGWQGPSRSSSGESVREGTALVEVGH
eukprot:10051068-Lingulodinium_polyedra.AAC.1